jgi:hypothetical protein
MAEGDRAVDELAESVGPAVDDAVAHLAQQPGRGGGRTVVVKDACDAAHGRLDSEDYGRFLTRWGPMRRVRGTGSRCHARIASWYLGFLGFNSGSGPPSRSQ